MRRLRTAVSIEGELRVDVLDKQNYNRVGVGLPKTGISELWKPVHGQDAKCLFFIDICIPASIITACLKVRLTLASQ